MTIIQDRFGRGLEKIREIHGDVGVQIIDTLKSSSPDLARYIVELAFGDVYSAGGLTVQERQLATIAGLTVLGYAQAQLKVHIRGALNVGCSREQVIQTVVQMALYGGFPAALNGVTTAKAVFDEIDAPPK